MLNKPLEYWAVLIGMVLYAATRDAEREPILRRIVKVLASGFLAFGMSPSLARFVGDSEILATVLVMAFGQIVLDVVGSIIKQPEFLRRIILSIMRVKDTEDKE